MFSNHTLDDALAVLGSVLADRGESFAIVAVGGAGLMLLGISVRPTRDLDVMALVENHRYLKARPLPAALVTAAREVADLLRLDPEWINGGPTDQLDHGLPPGFESRVVMRTFGGLVIHLAGRFDQICLKLYAAADDHPAGKHAADLRVLDPTPAELDEAAQWVKSQDMSSVFHDHVDQVVAWLGLSHDT